jgi:oligosaccharyltransferase complex subunit alpha (ribophorin I)
VVHFPEPLAPKSQITLGISYSVLNSLTPRPAVIQQADKQYLTYSFSAYVPSAYQTVTQKTKLKFPSTNVPDYTETSDLKSGVDPERKGATYTYGPYETAKLAPGTEYPITVRYEFTSPVITAHLLERDIEVSHWGGNLATEERYWLRNNGSQLANQFSRVEWTFSSYQKAPSSAVREITYPLQPGSVDPYFTDDIGNVSTSRYRPGNGKTAANLELKPRYPIFGGWNYSFKVGWNNDLGRFLRQVDASDSYVLKVPFLQGPKVAEGIQYERVVVRVVLPEGARNVRYQTVEGSHSNGLPGANHIRASLSSFKTYMDTLGRTTLTLEVDSLTDEARDAQLVVRSMCPVEVDLQSANSSLGDLRLYLDGCTTQAAYNLRWLGDCLLCRMGHRQHRCQHQEAVVVHWRDACFISSFIGCRKVLYSCTKTEYNETSSLDATALEPWAFHS